MSDKVKIISVVTFFAVITAVLFLLIPVEKEQELEAKYGILYTNAKTDEKSAYIYEHIDEIPQEVLDYYYLDYENSLDFVYNYPEHKNDYASMSFTDEELNSDTVPQLYMDDNRWAYEPTDGGYIKYTGCMAVSLTMANLYLRNNSDVDPVKVFLVADYSDGFAMFGGIDNGAVQNILKNLGFTYEIYDYSPGTENEGNADMNVIRNALEQGHVVMAGMQGETFGGHALIITSLSEDGTMRINDPADPEKTAQEWQFEELKDELYFIWDLS